ncbi:MAG TPA: DUF6624 domain-containing protein [Candidatus Acidoferrales bacterium]
MINDALHRELEEMRNEDLRVRDELVTSGRIDGHYDPEMYELHTRNASRLRELIEIHGWPAEDIAGPDGAEAAWLIAQHAIGEPEFQRSALKMLRACIAEGRVPPWQAAYLEDRIAMYQNQPQRYGTQSLDDPQDGRSRPWTLADPKNVDAIRATVGLQPLPAIPERGPGLPAEKRQALEENYSWWQDWLTSKGWKHE